MPDLYIKYREETPYQYRYGDESEVMRLFIDGGIVRRRKQRKRGNKNKVTDYSPEMLEMLARRRKYDEWRGEELDQKGTVATVLAEQRNRGRETEAVRA